MSTSRGATPVRRSPISGDRFPVRIGYVLKRFPHLSQTFVLNEILELERQGVEVEILSLRAPRDEPRHAVLDKLRASVAYVDESQDAEATTEQIVQWASHQAVDHLHAHFATGAAEAARTAAARMGLTYSFTAHARDIFHEKVDLDALKLRMSEAAFVVTVSEFNRHYLQTLLNAAGLRGTVYRLYNGLDLEAFRPEPIARSRRTILSVGRLVAKKGMDYLVEACALLNRSGVNFHCIIVGDGEERQSLEEQIQARGVASRVTLLGAMNQTQVIDALRRAELFVLPCVVGRDGDRDGLPTVILEAMALGTPVISTRLAGIPEMILDGSTGLLVEERDPEGLAQAISRLSESEDLRHTLSVNAYRHMRENFDLRSNVGQLRDWFITAANRHDRRVGG